MTTITATWDGDHLKIWVGRHRLRLLWTAVAIGWAAVVVDWARTWGGER